MEGHRDTVIEQFTRQAPLYASAPAIADAALPGLLVRASRVGATDAVLDVACGPGVVTCVFAASARSAVGLDLVDAMLERARSRAREAGLTNVAFVSGDAKMLPFATGTFDVVVSRFAVHHLEAAGKALAEMARVCAPGGRVVLCDVTPAPGKATAFNAMERLRDPSHVRALTESELVELVARAPGLEPPAIGRTSIALELDAQLARSFSPAHPEDEREVRRMFIESLADDRLGVGTRRSGDRIEYAFPLAVLVSMRRADCGVGSDGR